MSLIQDALDKAKKGSAELKPKTVATPAASDKGDSVITEAFFSEVDKDAARAIENARPSSESPAIKIYPVAVAAGLFIIGFLLFHFMSQMIQVMVHNSQQGKAAQTIKQVSSIPSLVSESKGDTKFVLSGITSSKDGNLALIDNQIVAIGDQVRGGAIVRDIRDRSVVLELKGKAFRIDL